MGELSRSIMYNTFEQGHIRISHFFSYCIVDFMEENSSSLFVSLVIILPSFIKILLLMIYHVFLHVSSKFTRLDMYTLL